MDSYRLIKAAQTRFLGEHAMRTAIRYISRLPVLATVSVIALTLGACAPKTEEAAVPQIVEQPAVEPAVAAPNTLTAEEQAAGWKLLFNGTDFTGWRLYHGGAVTEPWSVADGAIALAGGAGADLMTDEEFGPFELSLEWKISPNGNSGVIYLVNEVDEAQNTYNTGPEMQVLDDAGHPDGKTPSHQAGALYDFAPPLVAAAKPVGEWNQATIKFTGTSIEHWLNGQKVAESSYGDDAWRAKVAASKFKQWPLFGTFAKGHIALQDHGDPVWYRNIKIRPL
jgi:hypothetical protein